LHFLNLDNSGSKFKLTHTSGLLAETRYAYTRQQGHGEKGIG